MSGLPGKLLAVIDANTATAPLGTLVSDLLRAGTRWIWLRRNEDLGPGKAELVSQRLLELCVAHRATLSIGGNVHLAKQIGAHAIHLKSGQSVGQARQILGHYCLIGQSTHSVAEALRAKAQGADYVTLSPIFPTSSKPGYGPPLGLDPIRTAVKMGVNVVALGGITHKSGAECLAAGAKAIAVMGSVQNADEPGESARLFLELLSKANANV